MQKIWLALFLIAILCANSFAHVTLLKNYSQQQTTFKTEKVAGNVYVLYGQGGNIGVSYGEDGMMIIDTQFANIADKIKAELAKLGTDKPKFVFNTHWHGDHTGGNEIFGKDSLIVAHANVRKRMLEMTMHRGQARTPPPKVALPVITYNEGVSLHFNGEEIRAEYFPNGHTDGDTVLFFTGSNAVHLGDDFFVGRFPYVDMESGGTVEGLMNNIARLIQMIPADAKLIPGHGQVSTIDDLRDYYQMLAETTLIVRKAMKEGKTLEQIKATGFPEKFKDADSGFIKTNDWIETIYKSYSPNIMEMKK
ncbi:MBL fold metallo-hydrolase [soil metagenome]